MEFPNLGGHCQFVECGIYDFLLIECSGCHKNFCKEHGQYDEHKCKFRKDNIIDDKVVNKPKKDNRKGCVICKKKDLVENTCNKCGKIVCLTHRYVELHNCVQNIPKQEDNASFWGKFIKRIKR